MRNCSFIKNLADSQGVTYCIHYMVCVCVCARECKSIAVCPACVEVWQRDTHQGVPPR